jgi:Copper transport outer membrane protein, MctB
VISLRYHIVSLVAVFLALALGIVVGSTVLKEGSVTLLRATSNRVRAESEKTRADNDQLRAQLGRYEEFSSSVLPQLVRGRLKGQPVVLVDTDKVDDPTRDKVTEAMKAAGAVVDGRITFSSDRLALAADGDRNTLGRLLAVDTADAAAERNALIGQVVDRLALPTRLPQDKRARAGDVLTGLNDAKFLADLPLQKQFKNGHEAFPRPGTLFVLIGPTDQTTLPPDDFLIPLADRLSDRAAAVVGVEKAAGPVSWVAALRDARGVNQRVSSVDDVDLAYGQVAVVEALQRWLQTRVTGQYGSKSGASGLLPEKPGS